MQNALQQYVIHHSRNHNDMYRFSLLTLLFAACATIAFAKETPQAAPALATISDRFFEERLRFNPLSATEDVGDPRFEGVLAIDIAPSHRADEARAYTELQQALNRISAHKLSKEDRVTYDLLRYELKLRLDGLKFPSHLLPLHHLEMVPVRLAQWGSGNSVQPFKTVANYENYLRRIEKLPAWLTQATANLREGIKTGVIQNRAVTERTLTQLEALIKNDVESNPFLGAIKVMPASFSTADKSRLTNAYTLAVRERVQPAVKIFYDFVKTEYLPKTVLTAGLGDLPGGAAWYRHQVRAMTTSSMTADAIHELGLKEVARIRGEMESVKKQVGYTGALNDFLNGLNNNPALAPFKTEAEVLAKFVAIDNQIKPKLPSLFGRAPKAAMEIRPVDPLVRDTASSSYILPADDGSRPGVFYAAVPTPEKYTTPSMVALLLHEGQPGHHFQMAIQQELNIPKFRRYLWYDAYGEGWALYAESLGRELGVYDDPYAYLGRLQNELHRAVRLVTDTGLHAKGWSREKSIQYMMETQGIPEDQARRATERYVVWAGQALAYKTGELKILELKRRAKEALGAKFDVRAFHDEVLGSGALPLDMLETMMNEWIARMKKGA
jgi:uncharacterized protein (DUF885 family)